MNPIFIQEPTITRDEVKKRFQGGLLVSVLRRPDMDTTSGGVTSKTDTFLLIGEGIPVVFECEHYPDNQILLLDDFKGYKRCFPLSNMNERTSSQTKLIFSGCNGGNFIYSSDSRYHKIVNNYPIPVHDRVE